jgi:hypothetical protein
MTVEISTWEMVLRERLTEPVVDPEVWDTVPDKDVPGTKLLAEEVQDGSSDGETKIRQKDEVLVLSLIQRTLWVKVVDTATPSILPGLSLSFGLLVMSVMSSDVDDQIQRPSDQLLSNHMNSSPDWSLIHQLRHLMCKFAQPGSVF